MGNLLYGLNIATNTLRTQSDVLNITAHNIANANTPGYSRQEVELSPVVDLSRAGLRMAGTIPAGLGVEVDNISRIRNILYDDIYRKENQNLNFNVTTQNLLNQIEILFDEPSDRGLSGIIDSFFNGWLDLANDSQNMAARQSLSSTAVELTGRMKRIYDALMVMREDINVQILTIPNEINRISEEIADLNVAIRKTEVSGQTANDLRDKRDLLVDELTQYADARMVEREDGTAMVLVGNNVVVEGGTWRTISVESAPINDEGMTNTFIVAEDGSEYEPTSGELGALLNVRDNIIITIMGELNTIAESIVDTINTAHVAGYGLDGESGRYFFDPDTNKAYNISLSDDISDLSHIAVSGDGTPGNNTNAININNLKSEKVIDGFTINEYYNAMISDLGVLARSASEGRANHELLLNQIDNARETIKGVSIDEEMVHLIQAQRIYQSASRVIVVVDQLLEEVVNLK